MMTDASTYPDTPVFVMVWDKSLPNVGHWTDALPDTWLPVDKYVALTSTGLISPMTLTSDNWHRSAGSWQHWSVEPGDPDAPEDPATAEVRELARLAGYDGTVTLGSPELVSRQAGALEYQCWASFDTPAFVGQTIIVLIILAPPDSRLFGYKTPSD